MSRNIREKVPLGVTAGLTLSVDSGGRPSYSPLSDGDPEGETDAPL